MSHRLKEMSFARKSYLVVIHLVFGLVGALVFACIFGICVKLLWSVTITPVFGFSPISYWQGIGLVLLARLLFGNLGLGGTHSSGHGSRHKSSEANDKSVPNSINPELAAQYQQFWDTEGEQRFKDFVEKNLDKPL